MVTSTRSSSDKEHNRPYPRKDFTSAHIKGAILDFPRCEEQILQYWDRNDTFAKSLAQRSQAKEYVFYDGPPFANGLPHYGHLITGYVKDIISRYRTMRGYLVQRRFGWDTHGLPAELEAQRQLGIKDISDIEKLGIDKFNDYCRQSVLHYTDEWYKRVKRQARWVDFHNDYKTLDITFMESVLWAFKTLYDKGLIYQGYKVLPYSWSEQTPLSLQEARMDDATRPRQDPALTVKLPVTSPDSPYYGANLLVWTTTPWTLTANLAVGVHPDLDYIHVQLASGERYIIGKSRYSAYAKEFGDDIKILATIKGKDLAGTDYEPPFSYYLGHPNSHKVYTAEYITDDSGTGLVHLAPFGEDDVAVYERVGIDIVVPVDKFGNFIDEIMPYQGQNIFAANPVIIKDLKIAGKILRHETIEHAYPHSWRSGEPLIYLPVPSWFVKVTDIKPRMIELNKNITWIPEHLRDGQFGKWLENARDWNISRNRYWGSPIPVWVSDNPEYPRVDVYGSLDELECDFGVRPTNLHRPYIDELIRPNPDDPTGKSMMQRVPEVLDCWFESGSMPFASVHYPFDNQQWFQDHFPGDFIVEFHSQTRGWFYNLLVMSTALFDQCPFRTAATHGIILGNDGLKMSKSKRNYPPVEDVFDTLGADAMRWYLTSSQLLRGGNLSVTDEGLKEGIRQTILPLWNAYSFFTLYAEDYATISWDSPDVLDQYIIAKLAQTRDIMTQAMDCAALTEANAALRDFIEILTNWYIRRSRPRFWAGSVRYPEAFNTLYIVLETVLRLAAPLLPFISEALWLGLTDGNSVHLQDWPDLDGISRNENLVEAMDLVREVCSSAVSIRKAQKLRVRLPLSELIVAGEFAPTLEPFTELISDEVNVKKVIFTLEKEKYGREEIIVNARSAGPRLGKDVQHVIKAVKSGEWARHGDEILADGITLLPSEYDVRFAAVNPDATAKVAGGAGLVVLDLTVTSELEAEGWVKDRIRELQEARKNADLDISDRIDLTLWVASEKYEWVNSHIIMFTEELLASSVELNVIGDDMPKTVLQFSDDFYVYFKVIT